MGVGPVSKLSKSPLSADNSNSNSNLFYHTYRALKFSFSCGHLHNFEKRVKLLFTMPVRHSGLQKDVLKLYRDLHRAARKKDPLGVNNFTSIVMQEFRVKAASVTKTDFKTIEHLLRYGYKQKKLIEMPGFRTGGVTSSR